MYSIKVNLGNRSYPIVIGRGITRRFAARLEKLVAGHRLFVICDAQVFTLHGSVLLKQFDVGSGFASIVMPAGEKSKTREHLGRIYDFLMSERVSRSDTILAVGGGVVSDLAGYAAATTLRGIQWVVMPTTLVGMTDAAVGGKTGINHPSGKNLIGAFHQPRLVWCDPDYLVTLPEREMLGGLGEILKYAALAGQPLLDRLTRFIQSGDIYDIAGLEQLIGPCARYKAGLTAIDERDTRQRLILNLGHTFGHAIEAGAGYGRLLHGEAIILGLAAASHLSCATYPEAESSLDAYRRLVGRALAFVPRRKIDLNKTYQAMFIDKKRRRNRPNFILLKKLARPIIATDVSLARVRASLLYALKSFKIHGEFRG
ncbi:MAG: 3-dehydroquinate synthase [Candidatus Zixiibacteriota bacterium]|nr:MAG: 3-dehydroquinate synthase [candidate division Zixibacteria bacterium]